MPFQRRMWTAQRIGWAVMALVLLAAVLGLFGDGPLSRRTVTSADGKLTARFQRLERHHSPTALVVMVRPEPGEEKVELWLSRHYAEAQTFDTIHPEPESVTAAGDRMVYEFSVDEDEPEVRISFDGQPQGIGTLDGKVGLGGGDAVTFTQFVFP